MLGLNLDEQSKIQTRSKHDQNILKSHQNQTLSQHMFQTSPVCATVQTLSLENFRVWTTHVSSAGLRQTPEQLSVTHKVNKVGAKWIGRLVSAQAKKKKNQKRTNQEREQRLRRVPTNPKSVFQNLWHFV